MKKIFIIIPAYNEERAIGSVLEKLLGLYSTMRLVVVVDGATDETTAIARKFHGVVVLEHRVNRGQGAALETGDEYARRNGADVVIHFDADGQFDPRDIPKMIEPILSQRADVTLGSRFLGAHNTPFFRGLLLRGGIFFQWFLTGIFLSDAHNGFRVMNSIALRSIRLSQDRMAHATEVIEEIAKARLRFEEVPISVRYTKAISERPHAQKSFLGAIRIFGDIAKERMIK